MAQVYFRMGELVGIYFFKAVRRRTVIDHFGLTPDAGILWRNYACRCNRNRFRSLFAAASNFSPGDVNRADSGEIPSTNLFVSLSVSALTDRFLQQIKKLRFQAGKLNTIL